VKELFESFKLSSATSSTDVSSSVIPKELPPPPISSTVVESSSIQVDAVLTDSKETNSRNNSSLIFYEFQAKHFGAEEVTYFSYRQNESCLLPLFRVLQ
jgi:hypothetical protein